MHNFGVVLESEVAGLGGGVRVHKTIEVLSRDGGEDGIDGAVEVYRVADSVVRDSLALLR